MPQNTSNSPVSKPVKKTKKPEHVYKWLKGEKQGQVVEKNQIPIGEIFNMVDKGYIG